MSKQKAKPKAKPKPKPKVVRSNQMFEIISTGEKVTLAKNPILIIGFPGPGLIGTIATGRMIEGLEMKLIATIRSSLIPPVTPFFGGVLRLPIRIHASDNGELISIISEVSMPVETIFSIANSILDWAENQGVKKVVCLEGIGLQKRSTAPEVFGAAEPHLLKELEQFAVPRVQQGLVAGIAGAILNECLLRKLDGYCLLVTAQSNQPDPEAAASIISAMNRFLETDVSIQSLIRNQSFIKSQMNDLAEQERQVKETAKQQGYRPIPFYV